MRNSNDAQLTMQQTGCNEALHPRKSITSQQQKQIRPDRIRSKRNDSGAAHTHLVLGPPSCVHTLHMPQYISVLPHARQHATKHLCNYEAGLTWYFRRVS